MSNPLQRILNQRKQQPENKQEVQQHITVITKEKDQKVVEKEDISENDQKTVEKPQENTLQQKQKKISKKQEAELLKIKQQQETKQKIQQQFQEIKTEIKQEDEKIKKNNEISKNFSRSLITKVLGKSQKECKGISTEVLLNEVKRNSDLFDKAVMIYEELEKISTQKPQEKNTE